MIHLVSLNPSLDIHFDLDPAERGKVGAVLSQEVLPGGKALNVARFLRKMRVPCRTWIAVAGGDHPTHRLYRDLLEATDPGLPIVFIRSKAPVRFNLHLREGGAASKYNHPGISPSVSDWESLKRSLSKRCRPGDIVVLTGRLPKGAPDVLVRDWVMNFQKKGIVVAVDTSGPPLRWALSARPFFVKVNLSEMQAALGLRLKDLDAFQRLVPTLLRRGIARGAVTDGVRGSIAWEGTSTVRSTPPQKAVFSSVVGAGDGFLAGWLAGIRDRMPLVLQARYAAACGGEVARRGIFSFRPPERPRDRRHP